MKQMVLLIETQGRSALEITDKVNQTIAENNIHQGLCHIFVQHTSAALMISGNKDPDLLTDIEYFLTKIIPDADPNYQHNNEEKFDMSGHIRTLLIGEEKTIPIINGTLALGKFQGLFLYEQDSGKHQRKLIISVVDT